MYGRRQISSKSRSAEVMVLMLTLTLTVNFGLAAVELPELVLVTSVMQQ